MLKDVDQAVALGMSRDVPMPLTALVRALLQIGTNTLGPNAQLEDMVGLIESMAATKLYDGDAVTPNTDGALKRALKITPSSWSQVRSHRYAARLLMNARRQACDMGWHWKTWHWSWKRHRDGVNPLALFIPNCYPVTPWITRHSRAKKPSSKRPVCAATILALPC